MLTDYVMVTIMTDFDYDMIDMWLWLWIWYDYDYDMMLMVLDMIMIYIYDDYGLLLGLNTCYVHEWSSLYMYN